MTDLKELFKQAAEIAQSVPENMQQLAFSRALDLLSMDQQHPKRASFDLGTPGVKSSSQKKAQARSDGSSSAKPSKPIRKSSGMAPKSAVNSLIDSGFFPTGKSRAEVQEHLRTTRGYNIGADQLGVAMLRLVREGVLERSQNEDGQYEFKKRTT